MPLPPPHLCISVPPPHGAWLFSAVATHNHSLPFAMLISSIPRPSRASPYHASPFLCQSRMNITSAPLFMVVHCLALAIPFKAIPSPFASIRCLCTAFHRFTSPLPSLTRTELRHASPCFAVALQSCTELSLCTSSLCNSPPSPFRSLPCPALAFQIKTLLRFSSAMQTILSIS